MSTYWKIINHDKKEYLDPGCFNQGLKFESFSKGEGITTALILLLRYDWSKDRIEILSEHDDLYFECEHNNEYKNISHEMANEVVTWLGEDVPEFLKEVKEKNLCSCKERKNGYFK